MTGRVKNAFQTFFHWILAAMLSDIYLDHLMDKKTEVQWIKEFFIVTGKKKKTLTRIQNHNLNHILNFYSLLPSKKLFLKFIFKELFKIQKSTKY